MTDTAPKMYCDYRNIEDLTLDICNQIEDSGWMPDIIVAPARGGLLPGVLVSHYFDIKFHAMNWSTRDHCDKVSEAWLAEDAYNGRNILIIDDICDTGTTFNEIIEDWATGVSKDELGLGKNLMLASLHYRKSCKFPMDFVAQTITDEWVVYPIEEWFR